MQFSTNCPKSARDRMTKALGKYADVSGEFLDLICKNVEDGLIRIGDPLMYGGQAPVFPTEKATPEDLKLLTDAYTEFVKKCPSQKVEA